MGFSWVADVVLFCGFTDEDVEIFIDVLTFGFPSVLSFKYWSNKNDMNLLHDKTYGYFENSMKS